MERETRYGQDYPLKESPIQNLKSIRRMGMDKFLEEEKDRYTCTKCGGILSVHTGICSECGEGGNSR